MPDNPDSEFDANIVSGSIFVLLGTVATAMITLLALATPDIVKAKGWPLVTLLWLILVIAVTGVIGTFIYYFTVLRGADKAPGSIKRKRFETLRSNLDAGGFPARVYRDLLTEGLRRVDCFFGDKSVEDGLSNDDIAARTLFPRFLGLVTPAALWTAPSFDRCLLLGLAYPLGAVLLCWVASDYQNLAEQAVGLEQDVMPWKRALIDFAVAFEIAAFTLLIKRTGWKSRTWLVVVVAAVVAAAIVGSVAGPVAGGVVAAFAGAFGFAVAIAGVVAGIVAVAVAVAGVFAFIFATTGAFAGAFASLVAVAIVAAVAVLDATAKSRNWQGRLLCFFTAATIVVCLCLPRYVAHMDNWGKAGPLLLFLGLLTLINAPFDWVSLGLTRGLLRRGLEKGGWAPFVFGLLDAAVAVIVIALLAAAMVLSVQVFDRMAERGGGKAVLLLPKDLINHISHNQPDPNFAWICVLLLSTMIPSLLNLAIGGASLLRWFPSVTARLLKSLEPGSTIGV